MNKSLVIILLIICLGVSCTSKQSFFSEFHPVPPDGWRQDDAAVFHLSDSTGLTGDLKVVIRHDSYYRYRNLWLFVEYQYTNNKTERDTVDCILSDKAGNWNGNGFGVSYEYTQLLRSNFDTSKCTKITINHGMRDAAVKNITDVGITIGK